MANFRVLFGGKWKARNVALPPTWSAEEKAAMVRESLGPGKTVSMVARQHGVNPNQLFHCKKLYQGRSLSGVSAGEEVVSASELADRSSRFASSAAAWKEDHRSCTRHHVPLLHLDHSMGMAERLPHLNESRHAIDRLPSGRKG